MEPQEYLNYIYNMAVLRGLCRTRKEFAGLLGRNDKALSSAMNGSQKNLSPALIREVKAFADEHNAGIFGADSENDIGALLAKAAFLAV